LVLAKQMLMWGKTFTKIKSTLLQRYGVSVSTRDLKQMLAQEGFVFKIADATLVQLLRILLTENKQVCTVRYCWSVTTT